MGHLRFRHFTEWEPEGDWLSTDNIHYQEFLIDRDIEGDSKERIVQSIINTKDKKTNVTQTKENWYHEEIKDEPDDDDSTKVRKLVIEKDTENYDFEIDDRENEKKVTIHIDNENNYDIVIHDEKNNKKHTFNYDSDRARVKIEVPGKSNEIISDEDTTQGTINGSPGTTSFKYSTKSETLKFSDYNGHSATVNASNIDVVHGGGTNYKLTAAQFAVNDGNLIVLK